MRQNIEEKKLLNYLTLLTFKSFTSHTWIIHHTHNLFRADYTKKKKKKFIHQPVI